MVSEDTIPTNVYTSSYLRYHTAQYKGAFASRLSVSRVGLADQQLEVSESLDLSK